MVTSITQDTPVVATRQPMVPNSLPMVHTAGLNRAQQLLDLVRPRRGGEVQVVAELAEQRVADAAADQVQLVPVLGEQRPQPVDDRGSLERRHEGRVYVARPRDCRRPHLRAPDLGLVR